MITYLSFGAGVNSVALMLLLLDEGIEFETVFADTGAEYPHTYNYLIMLLENDYRITILKPLVEKNWDNLYEYYWYYRIIPARFQRICTRYFKADTMNKYHQHPCRVYIGFSYEERQRAWRFIPRKNEIVEFPLIEKQITREGCKQIIRDHGLKVPEKSGCYICPFQQKKQWLKLKTCYPDLWQKAVDLEDRTNARLRERNPNDKGFYFRDRPLKEIFQWRDDQMELFDDLLKPCLCEI